MSSVSSTTSASSLRENYLNLLITQLQNQDPTNPMDNSQMTTQLAQLSSLEQQEAMNTTFEKVLAATQATQATSLIGKTVSFSVSGVDEPVSATVSGVDYQSGSALLRAGDYYVDPDYVLTVSDPTTSS